MKNECFITRLRLMRFRSLLGCDLKFTNPMFLVGKNGAGKSNLVDAFAFLNECMSLPLRTVFENRGGFQSVRYRSGRPKPGNFGLRVDFNFPNGVDRKGMYAFEMRAKPGYRFEVIREKCRVSTGEDSWWFMRDTKELQTNVTGLKPAVEPEALALPLVGGSQEFAPVLKGLTSTQVLAIRPDAVQELQEPDAGMTLKHDGSNLASVIQVLESRDKDVARRVCEILSSIVPGTTGVRTVKHGKKLSLEFTQKWESGGSKKKVDFEAFLMSDGTLRALGILMAFYQMNRPRVVAIEEPEATIHPEALATILDLFRSFARDVQIIVTTHSPELLDAKWIEAENIRIVSWDAGVTRVRPLGPSSVAALKDHLMGAGELMRSNALDDSVDLFGDGRMVQMDLFGDEPA